MRGGRPDKGRRMIEEIREKRGVQDERRAPNREQTRDT